MHPAIPIQSPCLSEPEQTTDFRSASPLPEPYYTTAMGAAYLGDSLDAMRSMPDSSVNLVVTSPPFALVFKKAYGNKDQHEYVDWFCDSPR